MDFFEVRTGFEPVNGGFADRCVTTSPPYQVYELYQMDSLNSTEWYNKYMSKESAGVSEKLKIAGLLTSAIGILVSTAPLIALGVLTYVAGSNMSNRQQT